MVESIVRALEAYIPTLSHVSYLEFWQSENLVALLVNMLTLSSFVYGQSLFKFCNIRQHNGSGASGIWSTWFIWRDVVLFVLKLLLFLILKSLLFLNFIYFLKKRILFAFSLLHHKDIVLSAETNTLSFPFCIHENICPS